MKKLILLLSLSLIGCKKDEKTCNCGIVESDNQQDYSVVIRNECSNNSKKFYLTEGDWMNAHPGNTQCISNVESW